MTQRITEKMRDAKIKYLNEILEEVGSDLRFEVFHPWSMDCLAYQSAEDKKKGVRRFDGHFDVWKTRAIYDAAKVIYDTLYMLQSEGLLRKKQN